jgi:hypothetical protein
MRRRSPLSASSSPRCVRWNRRASRPDVVDDFCPERAVHPVWHDSRITIEDQCPETARRRQPVRAARGRNESKQQVSQLVTHVDQANRYASRLSLGRFQLRNGYGSHAKGISLISSNQNNAAFSIDSTPQRPNVHAASSKHLPHTKGKWASAGETITLGPWQCFIICVLFGWLVKSTGKYRFREAYIKVQGRTASRFSAAASACSSSPQTASSAQRFIPAQRLRSRRGRSSAQLGSWSNEHKPLQEAFGITVNAKSLTILSNGSKFEPLIGKPGDGASPSCAIVDEYHEHQTTPCTTR